MSDQRDITQREIDVARDKANIGGPAQAYARVRTNQEGSRIVKKRIDFGLTFTQKPWVAYGTEIDLDAIQDAYDYQPGEGGELPVTGSVSGQGEFNFGDLPLCTGYVTDYDTDGHGHYTGAWVAIMVVFPDFTSEIISGLDFDTDTAAPVPIPMVHNFTWSGLAIKDVSDSAQDVELADNGENT